MVNVEITVFEQKPGSGIPGGGNKFWKEGVADDNGISSLLPVDREKHIGPIITKLTRAGYPEDVASLEQLTAEERGRFRQWQIAQQTHWDNMFYQYQQGFLDEEYYRGAFRERVRRLAPVWEALQVTGSRPSFVAEIERILAEFPGIVDRIGRHAPGSGAR